MATPQGGFGLACKIDVSGTLATIAVLEAEFPEFTKFLAESTAHNSAGGYREMTASGKRALEPFSWTLGWDTSDTSHAAVVTAFDSDASVTFSIADPDGDEVIQFEAHVERIGRISAQEDILKAKVKISPTGAPTIT